ncbi:hypothetical protein V8F33_012787, partial [Rhypophila sp. PSN 637]
RVVGCWFPILFSFSCLRTLSGVIDQPTSESTRVHVQDPSPDWTTAVGKVGSIDGHDDRLPEVLSSTEPLGMEWSVAGVVKCWRLW